LVCFLLIVASIILIQPLAFPSQMRLSFSLDVPVLVLPSIVRSLLRSSSLSSSTEMPPRFSLAASPVLFEDFLSLIHHFQVNAASLCSLLIMLQDGLYLLQQQDVDS